MKAVRRCLVAASLLCSAVPLTAQAPFTDNFKFLGLSTGVSGVPVTADAGYSGFYASPYQGAFDVTPGVYGAPFYVWCIDFAHWEPINATYDVWVTDLDATDYSHTRKGISNKNNYSWAAYLAGQMDWMTNGADKTRDAQIQEAMWALLGYGSTADRNAAFDRINNMFGATTGDGWELRAAPTLAANWGIITCQIPNGGDCAFQEFLFVQPSPPTELAPEPASMALVGTGLAGVFGGNTLRRRRRKS